MSDRQHVNGMELQTFDDKIAEARERYMQKVSDALDEELLHFMIPGDRVSLLQDAALFSCFIIAVKAAECMTPAGQQIESRSALLQWWPIQKKLLKEVPPTLLEFGREAQTMKVQGTGEQPS